MTSRTADIRTKRVYDPPDKADGTRVLVDRLWPRGLRKEKAALTLWLKEIAPSTELREWFGHRYRAELARNDGAVAQLANLSKLGPMTLLYAARDSAHNHAVVLSAHLCDHLKDGHGHHTA
jgi:uncharacterized protein YeaO (DUF488 family)